MDIIPSIHKYAVYGSQFYHLQSYTLMKPLKLFYFLSITYFRSPNTQEDSGKLSMPVQESEESTPLSTHLLHVVVVKDLYPIAIRVLDKGNVLHLSWQRKIVNVSMTFVLFIYMGSSHPQDSLLQALSIPL